METSCQKFFPNCMESGSQSTSAISSSKASAAGLSLCYLTHDSCVFSKTSAESTAVQYNKTPVWERGGLIFASWHTAKTMVLFQKLL